MKNDMKRNCIIAQSGGPTAVINASACGAIQAAMENPAIKGVFAAHNGILGILRDDIFDLGREDPLEIELLKTSPASALGSCRYKVKTDEDYQTILATFEKYDIGYFFYIGGNDSMDTAHKVGLLAEKTGYPLKVMGIPKTVDNDLAYTDHTPGYPSVIKYLATMTMEAGRDTYAMNQVEPVNIIEAMGRNAGWIAAGAALARQTDHDGPHIILLPEVPFDRKAFGEKVKQCLSEHEHCVIVVSEGTRNADGTYISEDKGAFGQDAFGHKQLGGAAQFVKAIVESDVGVKARYSFPSVPQRAGAHWASGTDQAEAYEAGRQAVIRAVSGETGKMITFIRTGKSLEDYAVSYGVVDLEKVANGEKLFPREWITPDGFFVTPDFIEYARPLIQGYSPVAMELGLPRYSRLVRHPVKIDPNKKEESL